jgi:DNA modification methylase
VEIRRVPAHLLNPAAYNPRKDLQPGDPEYEKLGRSIERFGYVEPIVWNERTGNVVGGHQRLKWMLAEGEREFDVSVVNLSPSEEKALNIALNKISGDWDEERLAALLQELAEDNTIDEALTGFDPDEIDDIIAGITEEEPQNFRDKLNNSPPSSLFDTFVVPPFSVLDTRQGYWAERKTMWLNYGIRSEVGREDNLVFNKNIKIGPRDNGTSVFDPVLCEICYRWFCPAGGLIFDPFAGGSVRGVLAKITGHRYTGIELRQEQVDANRENTNELGLDAEGLRWVCDDSLNMDKHIKDGTADMVFTCPPYFDLEKYSDDPRDISNMEYDDFSEVFGEIMTKAARKLKENRFFVVVLSDVRDKSGIYRDMTGALKATMASCGLRLYNDIILLNVVGSAAFRVRRAMRNRKVVRVHQNVLVFFKGNPKAIQDEFAELEELDEEEIAAMTGSEADEEE